MNEKNDKTPEIRGGLPIVQFWAEHTLSPEGPQLWKTLFHKSACPNCSWGTGGQKGGFTNEEGEKLQRCMKSVEAISAEIKPAPAVPTSVFEQRSITQLQQLTSMECDRLERLSFTMILGSNNLADCSDLCHAPSTTRLYDMLRTKTSVVSLESLKQADCVVLMGSNPAYNQPRCMNELVQFDKELHSCSTQK